MWRGFVNYLILSSSGNWQKDLRCIGNLSQEREARCTNTNILVIPSFSMVSSSGFEPVQWKVR